MPVTENTGAMVTRTLGNGATTSLHALASTFWHEMQDFFTCLPFVAVQTPHTAL